MRVLGVLGVAAIGMLAAVGSAAAATTTYYESGEWHALSGTDTQNRLVCGMATGNTTDGRSLEIRAIIGDPQLWFTVSKPTWDIPPGTTIPVVLQEPGAAPWTLDAKGQAHAMTWALPQSEVDRFESAFRAGTEMTIGFPSGTEAPWHVPLTGSNAVDDTFRRCVRDYTARAAASRPQAPTQPFGAPATQPFSPPIATTPLPSPQAPAEAPADTTPALPPIPAPHQ